jgi:Flp pilus assembly protein protease CpaA
MILLFAALVVAAVIDVQTTRIPNALTFPLMLLGLLVQGTIGTGMMDGFTGLGVAFALHFALWQLKLEGAGDAKLMMAVGAFVGWQTMLEATLWRYVLQIPYAVVVLTVKGRWANFQAAARWTLLKAQGVDVGERPEPTLMPFGPLIALATPAAVYTSTLAFFG